MSQTSQITGVPFPSLLCLNISHPLLSPSFATPEEAVNTRRLKKSLTMYSNFDWGRVPRIQDRRRSEAQFGSPRIITQVYRWIQESEYDIYRWIQESEYDVYLWIQEPEYGVYRWIQESDYSIVWHQLPFYYF